jgi:hypothetical protein
MTEPTESAAEETAEPSPEDYANLSDDDVAVPDDQPDGQAKLRRRAQAAEAERDQLAARVETLTRNEIQRLVADKLADPADVWRDGATVGDLLADDGSVDAEKVDGLVAGLLETHGHWGIPAPKTASRYSMPASGSTPQPTAPRTDPWVKAFSPQER